MASSTLPIIRYPTYYLPDTFVVLRRHDLNLSIRTFRFEHPQSPTLRLTVITDALTTTQQSTYSYSNNAENTVTNTSTLWLEIKRTTHQHYYLLLTPFDHFPPSIWSEKVSHLQEEDIHEARLPAYTETSPIPCPIGRLGLSPPNSLGPCPPNWAP